MRHSRENSQPPTPHQQQQVERLRECNAASVLPVFADAYVAWAKATFFKCRLLQKLFYVEVCLSFCGSKFESGIPKLRCLYVLTHPLALKPRIACWTSDLGYPPTSHAVSLVVSQNKIAQNHKMRRFWFVFYVWKLHFLFHTRYLMIYTEPGFRRFV